MSKKNRDKHKRQQPTGRKVLPEPPPGFDLRAYYHSQMTTVYNNGVLLFGTADKFLMITKMESLKSMLQNLEGSVIHDCHPLDDILKTEPNYLQRIGLITPPGHGYARYTLYDLSQPEYPKVAAWFNPLVAGDRRWIPGDQPAANQFGEGLPATGDYASYKEWNAEVLRQMASPANPSSLVPTSDQTTDQVDLVQLKQTIAGAKFDVDDDKNDYFLNKTTMTTPDGKTFTGVVCTSENFTRAIDLLAGVITAFPHISV